MHLVEPIAILTLTCTLLTLDCSSQEANDVTSVTTAAKPVETVTTSDINASYKPSETHVTVAEEKECPADIASEDLPLFYVRHKSRMVDAVVYFASWGDRLVVTVERLPLTSNFLSAKFGPTVWSVYYRVEPVQQDPVDPKHKFRLGFYCYKTSSCTFDLPLNPNFVELTCSSQFPTRNIHVGIDVVQRGCMSSEFVENMKPIELPIRVLCPLVDADYRQPPVAAMYIESLVPRTKAKT